MEKLREKIEKGEKDDSKMVHPRVDSDTKMPDSQTNADLENRLLENKTERSAPDSEEPELAMQVTKKVEKKRFNKANLAMGIIGGIGFAAGISCIVATFIMPEEVLPDIVFPTIPSVSAKETAYYSKLTGMPVASASEVTAPAYCVQTPNGTDGARPQTGMHEAGVVFEAIAERGITRFASIYQNPKSAVIGPIRSLRLYYLQWDTPFDCTIVHAGGADDALAAVRAGGYKDLSENYAYMYRGNYPYYNRLWNNLFTNAALLRQFSADYGYDKSEINGFTRMTPEEAYRARVDATVAEKLEITTGTSANTSQLTPKVTGVYLGFSYSPTYNVTYSYNAETNKYLRSYETGDGHEVYECPLEDRGEVIPEDTCALKQMAPSVVVAMHVDEHLAEDGYHEDIAAIGSGEAVVFQNGLAVHGRWVKESTEAQIRFYDDAGAEIALVPGQTFVEAVPGYGEISWE
ncbi:DUF3048 domain-containing protein [Candidatus Saccharibacteria bacterium]|nr:DUF3048 domain-containing protein [Candidatus Saccharibacteria bacterium]